MPATKIPPREHIKRTVVLTPELNKFVEERLTERARETGDYIGFSRWNRELIIRERDAYRARKASCPAPVAEAAAA